MRSTLKYLLASCQRIASIFVVLMFVLVGCGVPTPAELSSLPEEVASPEEDSAAASEAAVTEADGAELSDYYDLAVKFWDGTLYEDRETFEEFTATIDGLSLDETELLVEVIDDIAATYNTADGAVPPPYSGCSGNGVPVYWDSWPSGSYPSSVYVTTSCGGDYDVGCRYNSVTNAYSNPNGLWFETNNAVVYGIMATHGYCATAYSITSSNYVYTCIGVGSSSYWYVRAMSSYFWGGLAINHS